MKILQQIYSENQIFVNLSEGLCETFARLVGVLQRDKIFPLFLNLLVNKIFSVVEVPWVESK